MNPEQHTDEAKRTDGGAVQLTHGDIKSRIAKIVGTDPSRYDPDIGGERHKRLTALEISGIASAFGMGLDDEPKQITRDAIMIRLGRDHRTGVRAWDSSDLTAVLEALEEADSS